MKCLHELPFERQPQYLLLNAGDLHADTVERNQSPTSTTGPTAPQCAECNAKSSMLPRFHLVLIEARPTAKGRWCKYFIIASKSFI